MPSARSRRCRSPGRRTCGAGIPASTGFWQPGGFGVFDPGINALSILTEILPGPLHVGAATLEVPENCATPIAARLEMTARGTVPVAAEFDWRHEGPQTWDIEVTAGGQRLTLGLGGARMAIDGAAVELPAEAEYPAIYRRFAALIAARESDVDLSPLRLCADAFLVGRQVPTAAFLE